MSGRSSLLSHQRRPKNARMGITTPTRPTMEITLFIARLQLCKLGLRTRLVSRKFQWLPHKPAQLGGPPAPAPRRLTPALPRASPAGHDRALPALVLSGLVSRLGAGQVQLPEEI